MRLESKNDKNTNVVQSKMSFITFSSTNWTRRDNLSRNNERNEDMTSDLGMFVSTFESQWIVILDWNQYICCNQSTSLEWYNFILIIDLISDCSSSGLWILLYFDVLGESVSAPCFLDLLPWQPPKKLSSWLLLWILLSLIWSLVTTPVFSIIPVIAPLIIYIDIVSIHSLNFVSEMNLCFTISWLVVIHRKVIQYKCTQMSSNWM